jgi:hypothetical protein
MLSISSFQVGNERLIHLDDDLWYPILAHFTLHHLRKWGARTLNEVRVWQYAG